MNYVRFMQYQLFIDEKVYDHFRCTDCKRTYLHEEYFNSGLLYTHSQTIISDEDSHIEYVLYQQACSL